MLFDVKLVFDDGTDSIVRFEQKANYNYFVSPQSKVVTGVTIDPDNWTMEQVASLILDVTETEANPAFFTMGPNPASDRLNVYFGNDINAEKSIAISDLSGRIIMQSRVTGSQYTFDVSGLARGTYLVQVNDANNKMVKRLVK